MDDWYAHNYEKSGYLWGEVTAIIIWGKESKSDLI